MYIYFGMKQFLSLSLSLSHTHTQSMHAYTTYKLSTHTYTTHTHTHRVSMHTHIHTHTEHQRRHRNKIKHTKSFCSAKCNKLKSVHHDKHMIHSSLLPQPHHPSHQAVLHSVKDRCVTVKVLGLGKARTIHKISDP